MNRIRVVLSFAAFTALVAALVTRPRVSRDSISGGADDPMNLDKHYEAGL